MAEGRGSRAPPLVGNLPQVDGILNVRCLLYTCRSTDEKSRYFWRASSLNKI